ncbi:hypothetical protein LINPERHAP2_LOCUS4749 [Linum perenne]
MHFRLRFPLLLPFDETWNIGIEVRFGREIWFVALGKTLNEVNNDVDAIKIVEAGKKGVVDVYLDTTKIESFYGVNEELESEWHNGLSGSDPEADVFAVAANAGVVHLLDDSDRTSDPEFLEAMDNLGVSRFRRRVHLTITEDGEEIEQLNEPTIGRGNQNQRAEEEIPMDNDAMVDMTCQRNLSYETSTNQVCI